MYFKRKKGRKKKKVPHLKDTKANWSWVVANTYNPSTWEARFTDGC
jgi:hypothetical protein